MLKDDLSVSKNRLEKRIREADRHQKGVSHPPKGARGSEHHQEKEKKDPIQDVSGSSGAQVDQSQWNAYYGYGQGYDPYAYGVAHDPSLYAHGAYAGYLQYPQQMKERRFPRLIPISLTL
ncbi:hypothetical protein LWI29_033660 [Acer saccharum]|uniref:Uncharacterized protein n=1 Tax=Acer saccharum TaxID=4024 RepID=A0AA39TBJ4_ACESA|nr:hypothetical protein LWI29_033660 [Acer saccharum]